MSTIDGPPFRTHEHDFKPAGMLQQQVEHILTRQLMMRPSLIMLCGCGEIRHEWVPAPTEEVPTEPPGPNVSPLLRPGQ